MPSNHVLINSTMEHIVSDSKMDDLLRWLQENGHVVETGIKKEPDEPVIVFSSSQIQS